MSLMHQGSLACFMTGVSGAFDHDAKVSRLSLGQYPGGDQFNSFAITKDKAGNITIKGRVTFTGLRSRKSPPNSVHRGPDAKLWYNICNREESLKPFAGLRVYRAWRQTP